MGKRVNTAVWMDKQKRWQIKVQLDGERRTFYSSTPGRTGQREANKKADDWLDEGIADSNAKVGEVYKEYIAALEKTTSQSNYRQVKSIWRTWITPRIGNKRISKVTENTLQSIIDAAQEKGLSKKTQKNILNTINAFFKFARKGQYTTMRPEFVEISKSARYKGKKILQPKDIIVLFNSDKTEYRGKEETDEFIHAYRFQVLTGLRPGELIGLEAGDIKGITVFVQRSVNRYGEVTQGKNENAVRSFILTDMAQQELQQQLEINSTGRLFGIGSHNGYAKRWKRYCEHNGISAVTPYELRHTFVSVAKNLPAGQVKEIVGHSANMDTFGIYGHEVQGEKQQAANSLEAIFKGLIVSDK